MHEVTRLAIAALRAEEERWANDAAAVAGGLARRSARHSPGRSVVYSIRLDQGEVAALETRAAAAGLKPSVLARNLIRIGLGAAGDDELAHVVGRLEATLRELRSLVA